MMTDDWTRWIVVGFIGWVTLLLIAIIWWSWLMERRAPKSPGPIRPGPPTAGRRSHHSAPRLGQGARYRTAGPRTGGLVRIE
jgi:hypothetical protein